MRNNGKSLKNLFNRNRCWKVRELFFPSFLCKYFKNLQKNKCRFDLMFPCNVCCICSLFYFLSNHFFRPHGFVIKPKIISPEISSAWDFAWYLKLIFWNLEQSGFILFFSSQTSDRLNQLIKLNLSDDLCFFTHRK